MGYSINDPLIRRLTSTSDRRIAIDFCIPILYVYNTYFFDSSPYKIRTAPMSCLAIKVARIEEFGIGIGMKTVFLNFAVFKEYFNEITFR